MDNLKEKGVKAFAWDFFGKMASHVTGFIVSIFLARLLEPADFGLIAMIMVIFSLAEVFTDVGLGSALVQRRRILPVHCSSVFYFNIFIGVILTIFIYYSAHWISDFYNNEKLVPLIQVMSFLFLMTAFSSVQNTLLAKEINYKLLTKIRFSSSLISGVIGVAMAFYGAGVWSLIAQILINALLHNIFIWFVSTWKPDFMFSWKALIQLWGFGFRIFLSGLLDAIFQKLDYLIIGKLFAPSILGYLHRAKSLNTMVVQYSSGSLMAILFPVLSTIQKDLSRFQNVVIKSFGIVCFIVFMLLGGLYLISEELIVILFSEKWLPSVIYFKILVLSGFAYPISAVLVNVLSSRGKSKVFLQLEVYKKIIVSVNLVALYIFGIQIYLYGLIVTSVLGVLLNILFASNEIKLPFTSFIKPILVQASITTLAVVLTSFFTEKVVLIDVMTLMIKGSMFTALYVLMNYFLKTSSFNYFLKQISPIIKKIWINKVKN